MKTAIPKATTRYFEPSPKYERNRGENVKWPLATPNLGTIQVEDDPCFDGEVLHRTKTTRRFPEPRESENPQPPGIAHL
jgi:hypothetical protein